MNFAFNLIKTALEPLKQSWDAFVAYVRSIGTTASQVTMSVEGGQTTPEQASKMIVDSIVLNKVFLFIMAALTILSLVLTALTPTIAPFIFVLGLLAPMLIGYLLDSHISIVSQPDPSIGSNKGNEIAMFDWMGDFYTGDHQSTLNTVIAICLPLMGLYASAVAFIESLPFSPGGLIISIIGVTLLQVVVSDNSILSEHRPIISLLGWSLTIIGLVQSARQYFEKPGYLMNQIGLSISLVSLIWATYGEAIE